VSESRATNRQCIREVTKTAPKDVQDGRQSTASRKWPTELWAILGEAVGRFGPCRGRRKFGRDRFGIDPCIAVQ